MVVQRAARAGTLESSDISVTVLPGGDGIQINLTSSVEKQFGDSIRSVIREVAEEMDVENVTIEATDRGALECTIRARVETALKRSLVQEVEKK